MCVCVFSQEVYCYTVYIWGFITHINSDMLFHWQKFSCRINVMKRKEETITSHCYWFIMQLKELWVESLISLFWFINTVSLMIQHKHKTQDRAAEWMWSGLCGWGSLCQRCCRRTEFLHCDPQTLLFSCWWTSQGDQSVCCCVWMSNWKESRTNSRTDRYTQTHTLYFLPSCWCSYMTLIYTHQTRSTAAPSNCVHTHSLYTTPDNTQQICLDDQDMTGLCQWQ